MLAKEGKGAIKWTRLSSRSFAANAGRYVTFQMAEVTVPRQMLAEILSLIPRVQAPPLQDGSGGVGTDDESRSMPE
jgi:hypothetical protein